MASNLERLSVLSATNVDYLAEIYSKYLSGMGDIDESWASFFADMDDEEKEILAEITGASWTPTDSKIDAVISKSLNVESFNEIEEKKPAIAKKISMDSQDVRLATMDSVQALLLIRSYRIRGHYLADLDPLNLKPKKYHPELDPKTYGFEESDYDRKIFVNGVLGFETASLREILETLKQTYCSTIGVEYMHIQDPEQKSWVQLRMEEIRNSTDFSIEGRKAILSSVVAAEGFENYIDKKHKGTKRFGLDGGEALVPALEQIIKRGGQLGLEEVVLGMAHRGRLNVLTNVMGKEFAAVFSEFGGKSSKPDEVDGSGDVKYHLGASSDREFDGNSVHLSLTPNPSHLEAVDPVVIGKVRAKQRQRNDSEQKKVMGVLLHGDAALAGQGVVSEVIMMSELPGYGTGGVLHIVTNNQIGFTTAPEYSRSGEYPTDVSKQAQVPIFHVNGDDAEAVVHCARIAMEFRQKFAQDVYIDIICYRRNGHNEGDEPMFTNPLMYKKIKKKEFVSNLYAEKLIKNGYITDAEYQEIKQKFEDLMTSEFNKSQAYKPKIDMLGGSWEGLSASSKVTDEQKKGKTGISENMAKKVGDALTTVPDDFSLNRKIQKQLDSKKEMFKSGKSFDWGTAESLAYGSLLEEGYPVRLSGQDSGRGTFSHRHAVFIDQENEDRYSPLKNISGDQARFCVHDSPLSENAVLGFEHGYSVADPKTLVLWEAQFGDFVNGAQVIIDQFISSSETKWQRMSGLVMLLPHGYEGQGPEHSSARMERFLQSSAEDNWQIVNCTTPANYFHALRRQVHRTFRTPLIIFTPKSLLRHKMCISELSEMTTNSTFHRVLPEVHLKDDKAVKRVILCSGKVYYDLLEQRIEDEIKDVAIVRLEQLYPYPNKALKVELSKYPDAEVVWCQEEPMNMGAWQFMDRRIEGTLNSIDVKAKRPNYIGRKEAASPAVGLLSKHLAEQKKLVLEALNLKK